MRYLLKQKFWSWGDDFRIQNADGQEMFFVDGRAFSWGDKLSFQDMEKNELAFIRQKLLAWGPTYEIEVHGRLVAVVKKKLFTLLRCKFAVDVPGPDDLEAQGTFSITSTPSSARAAKSLRSANAGSVGPTPTAWISSAVRMTCSFWRPPWSSTWSAIRKANKTRMAGSECW